MKKRYLSIFATVSIMLAACGSRSSSSGTSDGGSNNSTTLLGELPNGSQVMLTKSNAEITPTTPQLATISLVGGTANTSYAITFSTESSLFTNVVNKESDGITIAPPLCEVGTTGSSRPTSCQVTITASTSTTNGTHNIYTMALPNQDPLVITKLTLILWHFQIKIH